MKFIIENFIMLFKFWNVLKVNLKMKIMNENIILIFFIT